jgi:hypothetical protein
MSIGDILIIGISVLVMLLVAFAAIYPRIRKYRVVIKKLEPQKKRRAKPTRKKRKAIVIKLI